MLRCVRCGRLLRKAAATIPAVDTGPTPHPAGALGRTCARKAGLLPVSLFSRKRAAAHRRRAPHDTGQLEIAGGLFRGDRRP